MSIANVFVFWGGELCTHATPPTLYYTVDVQAVIPIDLHTRLNVFQHLVKNAMNLNSGENITVIGRVVLTTQFGMTHYPFQITTEEEWQYFIQQTMPNGELHVYITSETYVPAQNQNHASTNPPHYTASTSLPNSSHNMPESSDSSETSDSESILSGDSENSPDEDIDGSSPFDFEAMQQCVQHIGGGGQKFPDPNIPFYHSSIPPPNNNIQPRIY